MKRVFDVDLNEFSDGFDALILTSPQLDSSTRAIVDLEIAAVTIQAEQFLEPKAAVPNGQRLICHLPQLQSSHLLTALFKGFTRAFTIAGALFAERRGHESPSASTRVAFYGRYG